MAKKAVLTVIPEHRTHNRYSVAKILSGPSDETVYFRARKTARFVNVPTGLRSVLVYIHGDAEDAAGFDIPVYKSGTMDVSKDVQPVVLEVPSGQRMECSLFLWRADVRKYAGNCTYVVQPDERLRGWIVAEADAHSLRFAQECLRAKTTRYF
jgi:hypothetical protein